MDAGPIGIKDFDDATPRAAQYQNTTLGMFQSTQEEGSGPSVSEAAGDLCVAHPLATLHSSTPIIAVR